MSQAIQIRRFNGILGRLLGMAGVEDPAGQLSPEISPVLPLEVDRPEWKFLAGDKMCSAAFVQAAGVGARSVVRFRNPLNSGQVAVIEGVRISTVTAGSWTASANFNSNVNVNRGTTGDAFAPMDSRWGAPTLNSAMILSGDNAAVTGTTFESNTILAPYPYEYQAPPIVVFPNAAYEFFLNENNVDIRVTIRWRERPYEPYEALI